MQRRPSVTASATARATSPFRRLLTGTYSVRIEAKGFKAFEQHGIPLSAGDVRKLPNLALAIGEHGETVTVELGSAQIIPVENGQRGSGAGLQGYSTAGHPGP